MFGKPERIAIIFIIISCVLLIFYSSSTDNFNGVKQYKIVIPVYYLIIYFAVGVVASLILGILGIKQGRKLPPLRWLLFGFALVALIWPYAAYKMIKGEII